MTDSPLIVLIAEDSIDLREAYVDWFEYKAFRVEQAASGPETLDKATTLLPDCIVMDISLPGVDGLEIARRLRIDARTRAVRLIAMTGHGDDRIADEPREAGFDAIC